MKRVLSHCPRVESYFDTLDADDLMDEYAQGGADFNDQVIRNLCRSRNLKLITDDRDFNGQGISILTATRRLLG
jgi:predicted nucleic acid-binding protein